MFLQIHQQQKEGQGELASPLDVRGNIANKDEEKAEGSNAFFTSVFNSQTGYSQDSQPPVLEYREGELPYSRRKQLTTCCATWTLTSLWG